MLSHHLPPHPNLESTQFSTLQLPNLRIRILDKLTPAYYFISQLYLDHNALITLNGIQQFHNLEIFSFNFNHVASFNELNKIQNKFFVKQLAFIGNPLEADVRARYEVLVQMGFKQLERLNPIGQTRFGRKATAKQRKKLESIHRQYQQQQGKTQRYTPKFSEPQQKSSRKLVLKTETEQKFNQKRGGVSSVQNFYKSSRNNISTTLNKTLGSVAPQIKNQNRATKMHQNSIQVNIRPFSYADEDQQQSARQQFSVEKSVQELQQQSPIKSNRQNSGCLFSETGYFDQSSAYFKVEKHKYKNFAMEFLQQQKMEIAGAFRARHLKQTVFDILSKIKYVRLLQETQAKRKAMAAIQFYNILNKI